MPQPKTHLERIEKCHEPDEKSHGLSTQRNISREKKKKRNSDDFGLRLVKEPRHPENVFAEKGYLNRRTCRGANRVNPFETSERGVYSFYAEP